MQQSIFDEPVVDLISIDEAAANAKVSSATIRNWIKTGLLTLENKGFVSHDSFMAFIEGRTGSRKLIGRANKSQKDTHDHDLLSHEYIKHLSNSKLNAAELSEHYQASLSDSFRNKEGIYYTPETVVTDLLRDDVTDKTNRTFLDPCCGSGNFIVRALEIGFRPENVYGYDTDPVAVELTKKRIFERTGYKTENIINADFLESSMAPDASLFDFVYTNPPWGKKLVKEKREMLGRALKADASIDTCSLFFFACLRRLSKGGELGFLLPDSFFNIAAFESARIRALSLQILKLVDYDRPFKGLLTKAFAIVLRNSPLDEENPLISCRTKRSTYLRTSKSFALNPKSIINFQTNSAAAEVIEHLFMMPHVTLSGRARWGLGIVTGDNEKFTRPDYANEHIPVYRGTDISKNGLLPPSCYVPSDLSLYQQVAPTELYRAPVKLIYKFITSGLCFYCDTEQRYILNSVNMLVPNQDFPITPEQLCCLLNSDVIDWAFASLFKTHKVLRADLESIPIHTEYFKTASRFTENSYLEFLSLEKICDGTYRVKSKNY